LPTEALVAHVILGKYANHLPLYHQAQISRSLYYIAKSRAQPRAASTNSPVTVKTLQTRQIMMRSVCRHRCRPGEAQQVRGHGHIVQVAWRQEEDPRSTEIVGYGMDRRRATTA
jgi:hypothetical protein